MARLPQAEQTQFTQAPGNLYQRAAPVDISGFTSGLNRLAQVSAEVVKEKQVIGDETAVLDAYNTAMQHKNKFLYDPNDGVYAKQGMDALGAASAFDSHVTQIGENASVGLNPTAKRAFDKMWGRSNLSDSEGLMKFQLGEAKKYRVNTGNAVVDTAITTAIASKGDEQVLARSKTEILGAVASTYAGQSAEVQNDAIRQAYSKLHTGIVSQMVADNPSGAQAYYEANKEEITGTDHVQIGNLLRPHTFRAAVYKDADRITRTRGGPVTKLYAAIAADDPELGKIMEALGFAESTHRPWIETTNKVRGKVSPEKTAVGLTQVLVSTARQISSELKDGMMEGKSTDEVKELLKDPKLNLRYGTYYLTKGLKKYGGDLEAALIAYNAGPGNADKWLRNGRDYSVLPDREQTQPYVRKIMRRLGRSVNAGEHPKTAASIKSIGVTPTATQDEVDTFRGAISVGKSSFVLEPEVEEGMAQLWASMPGPIRDRLNMISSGGDALISSNNAFDKEWIMENAADFGLITADEEGKVRVSSPRESETGTMGPTVYENEVNFNDWLREADEIEDPTRRSAVVQELNRRYSAQVTAEKQEETEAKREAWRMALDGEEIPLETKKKLTPEYMSSIDSFINRRNAGKLTTDWGLWNQLRQMSDEDLRSIPDAMVYRSRLADSEFKQVVDMIRDAKGVGAPDKDGLAGAVRTRTAIVKQTLGDAFKNDPEAVAGINKALDSEIDSFYKQYGKKPTASEIQEMTDRLLLDVEKFDPGIFDDDTTVKLYQLKPGDFLNEPLVENVEDIPRAYVLSAIGSAQTEIGRNFTTNELLAGYSAALAYKRGAYMRNVPESFVITYNKALAAKGKPTVDGDAAARAFGRFFTLVMGIK